MLTKILFTALVVLACYLFIRYQRQRRLKVAAAPIRPQIKSTPMRDLALGLCLFSVVASSAFVGYRWWDDQRVLDVRVINATSGAVSEYQAYKGDVEGRSFITIDGRQISIADSERMEIRPAGY